MYYIKISTKFEQKDAQLCENLKTEWRKEGWKEGEKEGRTLIGQKDRRMDGQRDGGAEGWRAGVEGWRGRGLEGHRVGGLEIRGTEGLWEGGGETDGHRDWKTQGWKDGNTWEWCWEVRTWGREDTRMLGCEDKATRTQRQKDKKMRGKSSNANQSKMWTSLFDKGWELIKEPSEKPVSNQGKNVRQTYMYNYQEGDEHSTHIQLYMYRLNYNKCNFHDTDHFLPEI